MIKIIILFALIECIYLNPVPTEVDWRKKGAILPVPTQTLCDCGSAAIVNALDSISAINQIKGANLTQLSTQQIYDCSGDWCPCFGTGGAGDVLRLIIKEGLNNSLDSDDSYPYTGQCTHKCEYKKSGAVAYFNGFVEYPVQNRSGEAQLYDRLNDGPVVVSIQTNNNFLIYTRGIINDSTCKGDQLNHNLLLVGYGEENGVKYWIARNSWGPTWGENGYVRIIRDKQMCGFGSEYSQPLIL